MAQSAWRARAAKRLTSASTVLLSFSDISWQPINGSINRISILFFFNSAASCSKAGSFIAIVSPTSLARTIAVSKLDVTYNRPAMASGFNPLCMTIAEIRRVTSSGGSSRFNIHTLSGSEAGATPRRATSCHGHSFRQHERGFTYPSRRHRCPNKAPDQMVAIEPLAFRDDIREYLRVLRQLQGPPARRAGRLQFLDLLRADPGSINRLGRRTRLVPARREATVEGVLSFSSGSPRW